MPYIHRDLGVPCMTMNEFWASEAKREGKEAHELMNSFHDEIAQEEKRYKDEVLADKQGALQKLIDYYDPAYCDDVQFTPVEVVDIIDAFVSMSMRSNTTEFTAIVKCSDGKVRTLAYTETEYSGSYMEPGDFDCNCREVV
jgi:hypothetical protein